MGLSLRETKACCVEGGVVVGEAANSQAGQPAECEVKC